MATAKKTTDKASDTLVNETREALRTGGNLPEGVRINFGDPEPISKADPEEAAPTSPPDEPGEG